MNHIWTNDPTMALANNFFQQFSDRLAEIHVSGYRTLHDPLYQTQQREIIEAIQRLDVPLIEESGLSVDGLEKERTYLTEVISQRTDLV